MKAYEQKKSDCGEQRGVIWMIVEGNEAKVKVVCSVLDKSFKNDSCPDDDAYSDTYSEGYFIDRNDKAEFMAAYKAAKANI